MGFGVDLLVEQLPNYAVLSQHLFKINIEGKDVSLGVLKINDTIDRCSMEHVVLEELMKLHMDSQRSLKESQGSVHTAVAE